MKKNSLLWSLLIAFILFGSCGDDIMEDFKQFTDGINSSMLNDELLKAYSLEGGNYILKFENSDVSIPLEYIQEIKSDLDNWKTVVTFVNNETITIPSIGTSIDKFIINTIVNPSDFNPLSAKVVLNLPVLGKIKMIVHTKDGLVSPNVEYSFKSIEKGQTIPVLGLYSNYDNKVTLVYTDTKGNERGRSVINIKTEKLNITHLPTSLVVKTLDLNKAEPGMNLISSPGESEADTSIPYMVDMDGHIRWVLDWSKSPLLKNIAAQGGVHRMKNGNYVVGDGNNHLLAEVNILGEIVNKWDLNKLGYTFHHEVSEAESGRFLVAVTKNNAKLINDKNSRVNDHIIEFDPNAGIVTKEWDYVNMLDSARYFVTDPSLPGANFGQSQSNWLHNNAISSLGNSVHLSNARFHGPFKYTMAGDLFWIIAPHKKWRSQYQKYLLKPLDKSGNIITDQDVISGDDSSDEFEWPWGSHSPVMLPNGNILVFDNGYGRNYKLNQTDVNLYSRAVEYEVDEVNMTVRQVWQYGKERGRECYAPAMSSVQYLHQTGNRLFCPGIAVPLSNGAYGGRVIEIDYQSNEVVFELEIGTLSGTAFHRSYRMSLYPDGL